MALASEQLVVAGVGHIYVAPEGTAMPTSLSDALNAAFVEIGYTTDDGAKFTDAKSVNAIRGWQSFYPIRHHVTERDAMLEFTLQQWNENTVPLAFGGGSITEPTAGEYRYAPPPPETVDVRAMVLDIADGDRNFRIGIPKGFVTSNTETSFLRTGPSLLPITFGVMAEDLADPWFLDTDDPAFATGGS